MLDSFPIEPVAGPVDAVIQVPGSKSITNRALILAALADGKSTLTGALFSDDTRYMGAALEALGFGVRGAQDESRFDIEGAGGAIPTRTADLFVGNSGTTARFLTALVAAGHGQYRIDGVARMRERPIDDLLSALRQLGVDARSELGTGCPPVLVRANGVRGGRATMRGDTSSQFLTALLLVAPASGADLEIAVDGELASRPYVDITLRIMEQWGARAANDGYRTFTVPAGQRYRAQSYAVEPDASSASYFFAAAAVTGGRVRVPGLSLYSLQGDVAFVDVLERMGCTVERAPDYLEVRGADELRGVNVDMNGISDTVMTLAAIAPFASSPTSIRGVGHIRYKETDRIAAVATELRRLGVRVEENDDGLTIHPAVSLRPAVIETYEDHRIAMSFAVTGLRGTGISIRDPGCVAKTFPGYFARFSELYGRGRG